MTGNGGVGVFVANCEVQNASVEGIATDVYRKDG